METKRYTRTAIINSNRFSGYQRDFLAAVLTKPYYTLAEANRKVKAFFGQE